MTPNDWKLIARFGITPENAATITHVKVWNCSGLTALPDMPAATHVDVWGCSGLTALPDMPAATHVKVWHCSGLTTLPDLPAATHVEVWNCPGMTALHSDARGFKLLRVNDLYHAGCRHFTAAEAIAHWGAADYPYPERGAEYVKAITAEEARRRA